jgi:hypothetical protein
MPRDLEILGEAQTWEKVDYKLQIYEFFCICQKVEQQGF